MIEVSRLVKVYGSQIALHDVTLAVPAGQVLTLLGHNGSGKTTLLRVLATLVRPTAGSARIGGHDVAGERDAVRRLVGVVGHGTQLYDDLTALENLAFAAALAGDPGDTETLLAALARAGLEAHAATRVRALSSGMRRRVALARVMLRHPRVLLLDEPFSGLDQDGAKRLEEYIHSVTAEGGSAVVVTHNLGRGLELADRVGILAGGRLAVSEPRGTLTPDELQRLYRLATEGGA
jgi:heme ABC exporter ATP-binding subunit CcmA